jgi:hypothetical protein
MFTDAVWFKSGRIDGEFHTFRIFVIGRKSL